MSENIRYDIRFNEGELEVVCKSDSSFLNGLSNTNPRYVNPFSIKDVIFNDPAVIVLWNDGTKTVVKCSENDIFDPEKGLAMAISKKALGNQGNYYNTFNKYLFEYQEKQEYVESLIDDIFNSMCRMFHKKESE